MQKRYLLGLPALAGALAVIAACSTPAPTLATVDIESVSDGDNVGLTYIRNPSDPQDVFGDPTQGVYFGNGLSYELTTTRSIGNPPDSSDDTNNLLAKFFTLSVQGNCVTAALTTTADNIVINTVADGNCQVTFAVNGLHDVVVMPIHVVDQGTVPKDVYPPDLPPPVDEAGTDAGDEASTDTDTDAGDAGTH